MKMKIIQPYSKPVIFRALDCIEVHINLKETSEAISLEKLFDIGVRKNKKRVFLFISKVLGKHLAVDPYMTRLGGTLLAEAYYKRQTGKSLQQEKLLEIFNSESLSKVGCEKLLSVTYPLKEPTLFIGFAETATGLGHSMFSAFDEQATFIHTTREPIVSETPTFIFEEEHSHATRHECYTKSPDFFRDFSHIVLVDDEITTGNTALNLIEALHEKSGAKAYSVVALLDWRNEAQQQKADLLAQKLNIKIEFISVVQGTIEPVILNPLSQEALETKEFLKGSESIGEEDLNLLAQRQSINKELSKIQVIDYYRGENGNYETIRVKIDELTKKVIRGADRIERIVPYISANGRFGLRAKENKVFEKRLLELGKQLEKYRERDKTLCIGTEEFIYVPAMMACAMGEGIRYQSTTRSPIITATQGDYPLRNAIAYKRPEDETIMNYIYHILPGEYEEVFWFMERDVTSEFKQMILEAFGKRGIKIIHFVCCDGGWRKSDE